MIPVTELVRDRNAWSRAASRSPEVTSMAAICSAAQQGALWPLFHRGTSENWNTMAFATGLRSTAPRHAPQPRLPKLRVWNSSTALRETGDDLLVKLLKRRLCKQGQLCAAHRAGDGDDAPCRQPAGHAAPKTTRDNLASASRVAFCLQGEAEVTQRVDELLLEELLARRQLALRQRQVRKELHEMMLHDGLRLFVLAEDRCRSNICGSWLSERRQLANNWRQTVLHVTGMPLCTYRACCALYALEQSHRLLLARAEDKERTALRRLAYIGQLHAIEAELARCRRAEQLLRRSSH